MKYLALFPRTEMFLFSFKHYLDLIGLENRRSSSDGVQFEFWMNSGLAVMTLVFQSPRINTEIMTATYLIRNFSFLC